MSEEKKKGRRRGGNVKRTAPPGYYTARQAMDRLGLKSSTFYYYQEQGKIHKHVPPLKTEGYYLKKEIDALATELAIFFATQDTLGKETRLAASVDDAQGIVTIMESLGWPHASVEQYLSWWQRNPMTHFVVCDPDGRVIGNIACIPYTVAAREERLAGRKRAWNITPDDILPFHQGFNDVYVGIEVRQDVEGSRWYTYRLISGFLDLLSDLASQGILIRRMYAVSAEAAGKKLSEDIGFLPQPHRPGDLYTKPEEDWQRYTLNLETSQSRFAQKYRQSWKKH